MGFNAFKSDACIFKFKNSSDECLMAVYVDDCPYTVTCERLRAAILKELKTRIEFTDDGQLSWFLGMGIDQGPTCTRVHQAQYLKNVLNKFGFNNHRKNTLTPHIPRKYFSKEMCPKVGSEEWHKLSSVRTLIKNMNGCLLYLLATRHDLRFITSHLSRFTVNPGRDILDGYKHVFKYLATNKDYCVRFNKEGQIPNHIKEMLGTDEHGNDRDLSGLIALVDSDHGGDPDTRKSTRGFVIYYNGGVIISKSKLDTTISLSSAESELSALTLVVQELEWLHLLFTEFGDESMAKPIVILEDNAPCISMITEPNSLPGRTKHLALKKYWVNERIKSKLIDVQFHRTERMVADVQTKPVTTPIFCTFRNCMVERYNPDERDI